jgi:hypothetical protein
MGSAVEFREGLRRLRSSPLRRLTLLGTTDIDPLITAIIATPGTVQVNEPAQFSGQLIAGRLALTGGVTVHSSFKPALL